MKKALILFFVLITPFIFLNSVSAHPGRTASDGCHYCRTNCDSWGVPWNERHCHGGGSVQGVQESAPVYSAPTNTPIPWPTWTPIPTLRNTPTSTPTNIPSPIPTITITSKPTKKVTPKQMNKSKKQTIKKKTFWQWIFNR